jgi:hypothetical protein
MSNTDNAAPEYARNLTPNDVTFNNSDTIPINIGLKNLLSLSMLHNARDDKIHSSTAASGVIDARSIIVKVFASCVAEAGVSLSALDDLGDFCDFNFFDRFVKPCKPDDIDFCNMCLGDDDDTDTDDDDDNDNVEVDDEVSSVLDDNENNSGCSAGAGNANINGVPTGVGTGVGTGVASGDDKGDVETLSDTVLDEALSKILFLMIVYRISTRQPCSDWNARNTSLRATIVTTAALSSSGRFLRGNNFM